MEAGDCPPLKMNAMWNISVKTVLELTNVTVKNIEVSVVVHILLFLANLVSKLGFHSTNSGTK